MAATKNKGSNPKKSSSGFINDALNRAKKVFESTSSKAEETGKKALKLTEEIAETVSHRAEEAVQKIKELSHTEKEIVEPESQTKKPLALKPKEGLSVNKHLEELAEDIVAYLEKNGKATIDKIVNVMRRKKSTQLMVICAIGWLLHAKKITIGADTTTLAIKKTKK